MKILLLTFLIGSFMLTGNAQGRVTDLSSFAAMAGCWEQRDDAKKLVISEQWMTPAGASMLGMSRTVKDGKTTSYEAMRMELREGGLYFVSRPKENKEDTDFKMISFNGNSVTFENKEHDFPNRVIYMFEATKMKGRIEGIINGKARAIDFPMIRVACP